MRTLLSRRKTRLTAPVIYDGSTVWHRDNPMHREDGAAIVEPDGSTRWYRDDLLHREDGPAVEYPDGTKYWYLNGRIHRDGTKEWWLIGRQFTKPAWLREVLKDRLLTDPQRELLHALSENWEGTPNSLYETVLALSAPRLSHHPQES